MKTSLSDEAIARRMNRIGDRVRYASRPSIARVWFIEMAILLGALASLLFLYTLLPG